MLTNEDIKTLKEVLTTKEDLAKIVTLEEFDQFKIGIKQELDGPRESVQALTVSINKLAKAVSDMHQEYIMITSRLLKSLG